MSKKPIVIYLDQNKWIQLAKAKKFGDMTEVLNLIEEKVKNNEWVFPLSHVHLIETAKQRDKEKRRALSSFMSNVSNGWHIKPFTEITDMEFFACLSNKDDSSQSESAVVNSWPLFDICKELSGLIPQQDFASLVETVRNDSAICLDYGMSNKKYYENLRSDFKDIHKDKRENIYIGRFMTALFLADKNRFNNFMNIFAPEETTIEMGYDMIEYYFTTKAKDESWLKRMPTLYCEAKMAYQLVGKTGVIKEHDFNDIAAFSVAISSCDIVIGEKMWCDTVTNKLKLDKIFKTKIDMNLNTLLSY